MLLSALVDLMLMLMLMAIVMLLMTMSVLYSPTSLMLRTFNWP